MDISAPYADFMPGLEGPVLEVLAGTTRPMTGREVQRLARRGAVSGVAAVLDRLVTSGLVLAEPAGRAILYSANRDHLAWPIVESALGLRVSLLRHMAAAVDAWNVRPKQVTLFGSAARGDGGVESDIDLLLVRDGAASEDWEQQVEGLVTQVSSWTGNDVQVIDVDSRTWRRMVKEADPLVDSVNADGIDLLSATWVAA
ncbi:MAG TPA: nucleotidyltransferase domain-containing protein [Nocardioidaceae bacterium]|nr:nucleotidyltransferase domain-containing protein [Nocardioidaceae bacterium]